MIRKSTISFTFTFDNSTKELKVNKTCVKVWKQIQYISFNTSFNVELMSFVKSDTSHPHVSAEWQVFCSNT